MTLSIAASGSPPVCGARPCPFPCPCQRPFAFAFAFPCPSSQSRAEGPCLCPRPCPMPMLILLALQLSVPHGLWRQLRAGLASIRTGVLGVRELPVLGCSHLWFPTLPLHLCPLVWSLPFVFQSCRLVHFVFRAPPFSRPSMLPRLFVSSLSLLLQSESLFIDFNIKSSLSAPFLLTRLSTSSLCIIKVLSRPPPDSPSGPAYHSNQSLELDIHIPT